MSTATIPNVPRLTDIDGDHKKSLKFVLTADISGC